MTMDVGTKHQWDVDLWFHQRKHVTVPFQGMTETETCFRETCFRFHSRYSSISRNDGNRNVFPGNMFPFPSIFG